MESLAYVHLAAAWEESPDILTAAEVRNFFDRLKSNKLSTLWCIRWLSIGLSLAILSVASQAKAAQRGDSGNTVSCVQHRLNDYGYFYGPFTNFYGSLTENAVIQFQRHYSLRADGIAGGATLSKLGCSTQSGNSSSGSGNLARGASGSAVSALQQKLKVAGFYNGPITGYFGSLTEDAVIRLQQYYRLQADGIAGASTLLVLNTGGGNDNPASVTGNLSRGSRGQAVTDLQNRLRSAGFYDGPTTGYYGSLTQDAVKRFQRYYGLRADGIAGRKTQTTLDSVASGFPSDNSNTERFG